MSLRGKVGALGAAITLAQLGVIVRDHWLSIPSRHRTRVQTLVIRSRGRLANLTRAERTELRALIGELRLAELARRAGPVALGASRRGRRRLF